MARVTFDLFPGGKRKALTMSYDDGVIQDRRLVGIFNQHGIKGTFHLNSGILGKGSHVQAAEVAELYQGHEVSVHGVMHCCLPHLSREAQFVEILEDRRNLERLVGYPVRGMSYAGGDFDDRVVAALPGMGIEYARTTHNRQDFRLPEDPLRWAASCHHRDGLEKGDKFLAIPERWGLQLFYVWGHSYEFDRNDNWLLAEQFCEKMGGRDDIWYATNIEIVDYMNAMRSVRCSVDETQMINLSSQTVWFSDGSSGTGQVSSIAAGATVTLAACRA